MKIILAAGVLAAFTSINLAEATDCTGCVALLSNVTTVKPPSGVPTIGVPVGEQTVNKTNGQCIENSGDCGQRVACTYTSNIVISGIPAGQTGDFKICTKEWSGPTEPTTWTCGTMVPVSNGTLGNQTTSTSCGLSGKGRFSVEYGGVTAKIQFDNSCTPCSGSVIEG